jgi:hypothetical protein
MWGQRAVSRSRRRKLGGFAHSRKHQRGAAMNPRNGRPDAGTKTSDPEARLNGCWVVLVIGPDEENTSPWAVIAGEIGDAVANAIGDWKARQNDPTRRAHNQPLKAQITKVHRDRWITEAEWGERYPESLGAYDWSKLPSSSRVASDRSIGSAVRRRTRRPAALPDGRTPPNFTRTNWPLRAARRPNLHRFNTSREPMTMDEFIEAANSKGWALAATGVNQNFDEINFVDARGRMITAYSQPTIHRDHIGFIGSVYGLCEVWQQGTLEQKILEGQDLDDGTTGTDAVEAYDEVLEYYDPPPAQSDEVRRELSEIGDDEG